MNILTIGGATQDVFIHYHGAETIELHSGEITRNFLLLPEGAKLEVEKITYASGGGATNSAVSFKRLGFNVASFFKCGAGHHGEFLLQELQQAAIDISSAIITAEQKTGISYIIPLPGGDRTIFAFRGANATIRQEEVPWDKISWADCLYITSLSGKSSELLPAICARAQQEQKLVAHNPGISQLAAGAEMLCQALADIDILIVNSQEAQQLMASLIQTNRLHEGTCHELMTAHAHAPELLCSHIVYQNICFNLIDFFVEIRKWGPQLIVVTNGAEGVYVSTSESLYFHPSLPVNLVNTLGAGDAFGSAFVAALSQNLSVPQALVHGIINSTSVISHLDAKQGLLTADQLNKKAQDLGLGLVQMYGINN
jgi:ribokinase